MLTNCLECGKENVSDTTASCLYCGFNVAQQLAGSGSPRNVCQRCGYKWYP